MILGIDTMKFFSKTFIILGALAGIASADMGLPNLDRTDKTHERRYLDSINVYQRRPIRLNQSGFRPQDYKYAYVADPKVKNFSVIDANTGAEAWSGTLSEINRRTPIYNADSSQILGYQPVPITKPSIYVNGAFSSITQVYEFGKVDDSPKETETLFRADFTGLNPSTPGEYFVVVGKDTSATFHIHPSIFNSILESSLKFFGVQRCGNTKSNFHGACHLKDGSAVGHDLTGGWHDCGDHFKVSETLGYTAYVLSMVYLTYQDKAEDRYGESYADTVFTDGIPDILHEAKVGTDYILKLYKASKADGLIEQGEMYHSVGVADGDHAYWDKPERQDAQSPAQGGPDRDVTTGIGTGVAGIFAAALANVAVGYQVYDPAYSDSLIEAAKDIYKNVMMPAFKEKRNTTGNYYNQFYTGMGPMNDDCAAAALALWYATKDTTYQYDLYKNTALYNNATNYMYNLDYFKGGFLGNQSGFTPGGWASDYQNVHAYVLFAFQKMILANESTAEAYGLSPAERDTLSMRTMATFRKLIDNATNDGDSLVLENPATQGEPHEGSSKLHVITPYNLVWTSFDWGVMRYNMGTAVSIFLMYELTGDERYLKVALDNMYFILGANPWDISFLMGAGDKNPQHPHNRASNPDGYNAGGMPYEYRCPIGALMGAREPNKTLIEDWNKYTSTETCIDFTAQFLFPAQSLAQPLPEDNEGPLFSNIAGTPISDNEAIISWDANEVALVTVFYNTTPDPTGAKSVKQTKATKGGQITLEGLTLGTTYYFFLEGMDTKRNMTTDDNHGQWYQFVMTNSAPDISGLTICQVDHRSAKIYWWTSERSNGMVNFGKAPKSYTNTTPSTDGAVLFHEVKLTGLDAGTTYYFNVSSGATTDDNNGAGYSFTTESYATYADLEIAVKPSSYGSDAKCSTWQECHAFILSLSNNDTVPFTDFDIRLYLGKNSNIQVMPWGITQNFKGNGQMTSLKSISYGTPVLDGSEYYLPIHIEDSLTVSGQMIIQVLFSAGTYKDFEGSWSLRPHERTDDPAQFKGIDLTKGPAYKGSETTFVEDVNGVREVAFTKDPYITVYYHGKHIYGYGPDYTPENGPQVNRTVTMNFTSPFVSPHYSIEKVDYKTRYEGSVSVTPIGFIDDVQMNGVTQNFIHDPETRKDFVYFAKDSVLAYGNNYMEWVGWHNHAANQKSENKYDCACDVVRTLVEIDSITTPVEKRYLVFDKSSYKVYEGKMAEVHVQLYDSLANPMDTVNVTVSLGTGNDLAYFYATPTATIPITSINLVNGQAVFYVTSKTVATTTLFAKAPNTSTRQYQIAEAELIIEELPPWPIIDIAKMVDTDCDNIPDALQITTTDIYQPNQKFHSVKYSYGTDTITTTHVLSHEGKNLVIALDLKNATVNTNPSGTVTLLSTVDGAVKSHEDFYSDGIAPTLLSVSVLERQDSAKSDRVYMQFSEPISAPGTDWPTLLFAKDQITATTVPEVLFTKLYNDSLNVWEFEIGFAPDGSSLVTEGMFAQLMSNSAIKDKNGNGVATECGQPKLPVLLKLLPIPMSYAAISDLDEDGIAEHIDIEFERAMDDRHVPDQFSIIFGRVNPETLWVAGTDAVIAADRISASINAKNPFSYGITSGTFTGSSRGMAIEGAGQVTEHLGTGASYETASVLAEDKVGPVIASAFLNNSSSGDIQFVTIGLSESVAIRDTSLVLYRQKQDTRDTAIYKVDLLTWDLSAGNYTMLAGYDSQSELAVNDGDFVRLQPKERSAFMDQRGNMPVENSPWVPIAGKGKPKIKFNVHLVNQVSTSSGTNVSATLSNTKQNARFYVLNPNTKKLDLIVRGVATPTGLDSTALSGAVWKIEMNIPRGAASTEAPAWDTLRVKYNIPIYSNLGSYVNRFAGAFKVLPNQYFSSAGKVIFYAELANMPLTGIQTEDGTAVGTGAYIYKAQFECKFSPNKEKDFETISSFTHTNSYDKTETFGIKRMK
ncbi:MAG: glycoside hydrolase family 9 protein [Fibrobacter sp.]|nr:glycoside hydrolase family 9 protein [Fibrobacter sp.]